MVEATEVVEEDVAGADEKSRCEFLAILYDPKFFAITVSSLDSTSCSKLSYGC